MLLLKTLLIIYPKIWQSSQKNSCTRVSFLLNLQDFRMQLYLQETPAQVFSCKFCKSFNNTFLKKHFRLTPSTPKFRPTPVTPFVFLLTHAKILQTHATDAKNRPTLPKKPRTHDTHTIQQILHYTIYFVKLRDRNYPQKKPFSFLNCAKK